MECPHCHKEISESGFVYCPHCGKQLIKEKKANLRKGGLITFLIWVIANAIFVIVILALGGFWNTIDYIIFMGISALAALYGFGVFAMYKIAKLNNRNAVRWMTASIVFTPVITWIVYGLSWSKSSSE
jgi:predicted nucleic acid-binding Zn ribbon protein